MLCITVYCVGDGEGGHCLARMEWHPAGWLICLPLLVFRCTIKSRSFLMAPAHLGGPGKRAVKWLWCGGGAVLGMLNNNSHFRMLKLE